jgi:hypothetical protein
MNIDTFLKIGKQHTICEDYIIAGENPFPYIILADGCSLSEHTDLGARLLCHSVKFLLQNNPIDYLPRYETIADFAIHNVKYIADLLYTDPCCLDATLIVSFLHENCIYVYMYGDGNIITISHKNVVANYKISYKANAPDYLSYRVNKYREQLYKNLKDNERQVIKYSSVLPEPLNLQDYGGMFTFPLDTYKCVLIASDGIDTFFHPENGSLPTKEILDQLVAFKNPNGEFVKRRLKRMVKQYESNRIYHYDDISIGGFHT